MSYLKYIIKYLKHSQTLVLIIIIYQANVVPKASFFVPSDIVPNVYNKLWVGGIATGLSQWGHAPPLPPTSISKPKKVQHFRFPKSEVLLLMGVQKLYGLEISRFLPCYNFRTIYSGISFFLTT